MIGALLTLALAAEIIGGGLLIWEIEQRSVWAAFMVDLGIRALVVVTMALLMTRWV